MTEFPMLLFFDLERRVRSERRFTNSMEGAAHNIRPSSFKTLFNGPGTTRHLRTDFGEEGAGVRDAAPLIAADDDGGRIASNRLCAAGSPRSKLCALDDVTATASTRIFLRVDQGVVDVAADRRHSQVGAVGRED
jgi:hypothetical protein